MLSLFDITDYRVNIDDAGYAINVAAGPAAFLEIITRLAVGRDTFVPFKHLVVYSTLSEQYPRLSQFVI